MKSVAITQLTYSETMNELLKMSSTARGAASGRTLLGDFLDSLPLRLLPCGCVQGVRAQSSDSTIELYLLAGAPALVQTQLQLA